MGSPGGGATLMKDSFQILEAQNFLEATLPRNIIPFYGVDATRQVRPALVYAWAENLDIRR